MTAGQFSEPAAPDSTVDTRFVPQTLATQSSQSIVGLVDPDDFRKKQAAANNQKDRVSFGGTTETSIDEDKALTPDQPASFVKKVKKRKSAAAKGKLSFGAADESDEEDDASRIAVKKRKPDLTKQVDGDDGAPPRKRLGANTLIVAPPKVMTKSARAKDAAIKDRLRKEFLAMQEAVKASEFEIPFVFFDGTNNPGGRCRIKKGEQIWLFLDRSRKIGAELGVSGGVGERAGTRREWARVSVDDLMLVRGELIIPHHYDFYYFIINKNKGYDGKILFPYSSEITQLLNSGTEVDLATYDPLTAYKASQSSSSAETHLEGSSEDPTFTKVVDRRWYERNKHIYPASAWEEFDATKDYATSIRRDPGGNAYFFS